MSDEGGLPPEASEALARGQKLPLAGPGQLSGCRLDRDEIERFLPHRDPLLLMEEVTGTDAARGWLHARHDLSRSRDLLAGHFPGKPVFPGVLQVEAIAQAGVLFWLWREGRTHEREVALTHIFGARFMRPVLPREPMEIRVEIFEEGLFFVVVGQCLQNGKICSLAALQGMG